MQDRTPSKQPSQSSTHADEIARLIRELNEARASLNEARASLNEARASIEFLTNLVITLKEENQKLKDEIARLKGDNPKPIIPPSNLESRTKWKRRFQKNPKDLGKSIQRCFWTGESINGTVFPLTDKTIVSALINLPANVSTITKCAIRAIKKIKHRGKRGQPRGKHRSKKRGQIVIHNKVTLEIPREAIPSGAVFKGYRPYQVQDISFCTNNTMYLRAQWQLPNGEYIVAELPSEVHGHYGPTIISYIMYQSHACRVTEPLLLSQLRNIGIKISAGQISAILTKKLDTFHEEVGELLPVGVNLRREVKTDDTGGRHKGVNQYTTVIGNEFFSCFTTTDSKSRVNFLMLLQGGIEDYLINEDTIAYLQASKGPSFLHGYIGMHSGKRFRSKDEWESFLKERQIIQAGEVRLVTEATLFASLFQYGIPRDLAIHSDDAGQFDIVLFWHTLCWIHEERHYRKLVMTDESGRTHLERVKSEIWSIYEALKVYKSTPSDEARALIEKKFDEVFLQDTSSPILNQRLRRTYGKKKELLGVLERIDSSLHNNPSETDARRAKSKLKVSGGTRSDAGRKARDTFLSLMQTCLKLGINFQKFIQDRVCGLYNIPKLSVVMRQQVGKLVAKRIQAFVKAHRYIGSFLDPAKEKTFAVIQKTISIFGLQPICQVVSAILSTTVHGPPEQQEDNGLCRNILATALSEWGKVA